MRILFISLLSFSLIGDVYQILSGFYGSTYSSESYEFDTKQSKMTIKNKGLEAKTYLYEEGEKKLVIYKPDATCVYAKRQVGTNLILIRHSDSSASEYGFCSYQYTIAQVYEVSDIIYLE